MKQFYVRWTETHALFVLIWRHYVKIVFPIFQYLVALEKISQKKTIFSQQKTIFSQHKNYDLFLEIIFH